jgi:hypothetical protein
LAETVVQGAISPLGGGESDFNILADPACIAANPVRPITKVTAAILAEEAKC